MLTTILSLIETNNPFLYGQFTNNDLKKYSYISQNLFRYPANTYSVLPVIVYFTTNNGLYHNEPVGSASQRRERLRNDEYCIYIAVLYEL